MKSYKDIIFENFVSVRRGTEFILKAIPQDKLDFALPDDGQIMGELARHISILPFTNTYFIENQSKERPPMEEIQKILGEKFGSSIQKNNYVEMFDLASDYFLHYFGNKTDKELVEGTYSNFIRPQPTPYLTGFLFIEDHLVQHRGTLFAYLRALNIPVTMKQYFGMEEL